jgi:parallel beta helix pectate lyase-like protein
MSRRRHGVHGLRAVVAVSLLGVLLVTGLSSGDPAQPAVRAPSALSAALSATSGIQGARQSAALTVEDQRLLTLVTSVRRESGPYLQDVAGTSTLVLTPRELPYGLEDLLTLGAARTEPDDAVLLTQHVFVAPGARLAIEAPGRTLRLISQQSGFVSLVAWKADLTLTGDDGRPLTVTSWNAGQQTPDATVIDGRAYVRAVSGSMEVRHVAARELGFWAGRTSGVAWTGSSRTSATGLIVDSTFRDNHYGAFASQGQGLTVTGSDFSGNAVDGLSLHRSTENTTIQSSTARSNGRNGFSADQGSESVSWLGVTAEGNHAHGIFFSGRRLSDGQSASGAAMRTYGHVVITGGVVRDNGEAGIRVVDGHDVAIRHTRAADNTDGIALAGAGAPTTVAHATVTDSRRFGVSVNGGSAAVTDNELSGGQTAIRVHDAAVAVSGNTVRAARAHAVSVVGAAGGSSLEGNTLAGRGPSGLDLYRLDLGVTVDQQGNDLTGWTQDRDNATYWSSFIPNHPMLLLWVVVLGAPLAFSLRVRNRPRTPGMRPYRDQLRREQAAPRVQVGPQTAGGQV